MLTMNVKDIAMERKTNYGKSGKMWHFIVFTP